VADTFEVTLIAPDGTPYEALSRAEALSLVYGHGYRPKDREAFDAAVNDVGEPEWPTPKQPSRGDRKVSDGG
jgi:hypothetical protein